MGPNLAERLVDLSVDGAGVLVRSAVQVGEEIELTLTGQGATEHLKLVGKVLWLRSTGDGFFRSGLRFQRRLSFPEIERFT